LNHAETNINSQRVIASIHSYNDEALPTSFASSYFLSSHTVGFAIYHLYLGTKTKDCQQGLHPWIRFRERPQRRYKCWFSIPFSYDINRGKNTHSRYVANTFLFPSPRPSLHVLPSIHEIPANYDKSITDGRRYFIQVNKLTFFYHILQWLSLLTYTSITKWTRQYACWPNPINEGKFPRTVSLFPFSE